MIVYDLSIEFVRLVHLELMPSLRSADGELAQQLHRSSRSVTLNISEARSARGKRRGYQFSIALGSARESHACLELASATRILPAALDEAKLLALSDRIQAMLWSLSR